jgi:hypothetical protein
VRNDATKSLKAGVQFSSEVLFPGGSNFVNGDLRQGSIHAVLGMAARLAFGFPGLVLVSANSLTKAVTGRHLYETVAALYDVPDISTPLPPPQVENPQSSEPVDSSPFLSPPREGSQPPEKKKRTHQKSGTRRDASGKLKS